MTKKTVNIGGQEVPVVKATKKYANKADFDNDVANPNSDTTNDDLQINQKITVDSLEVFGKTE